MKTIQEEEHFRIESSSQRAWFVFKYLSAFLAIKPRELWPLNSLAMNFELLGYFWKNKNKIVGTYELMEYEGSQDHHAPTYFQHWKYPSGKGAWVNSSTTINACIWKNLLKVKK